MRGWCWLAIALLSGVAGYGQQAPVFQVEFTNAKLVPEHWVLKLNPDGSGWFDADGGEPRSDEKGQILAGPVHRAVQLTPEFTARVFATARAKKLFAMACDSRMKVAFQGIKRFSYTGPEGSGSCEYNYSKDKEIQALGDALLDVEATLMYGARLEKLQQHDRLGLDKEMENLATAVREGNAAEVGTIRETLTQIAEDPTVLERARKKAKFLLASKAETRD